MTTPMKAQRTLHEQYAKICSVSAEKREEELHQRRSVAKRTFTVSQESWNDRLDAANAMAPQTTLLNKVFRNERSSDQENILHVQSRTPHTCVFAPSDS